MESNIGKLVKSHPYNKIIFYCNLFIIKQLYKYKQKLEENIGLFRITKYSLLLSTNEFHNLRNLV